VIRITVAHGEKDYPVLLKERLSKMPAATKDHNRKYEAIEKLLLAQKAQLTKQVNGRVNEVHIDREPDDEAALASSSSTNDMAALTLERERSTLQEIESALRHINRRIRGVRLLCRSNSSGSAKGAPLGPGLCTLCGARLSFEWSGRRLMSRLSQ
jgi:hypothetical protein